MRQCKTVPERSSAKKARFSQPAGFKALLNGNSKATISTNGARTRDNRSDHHGQSTAVISGGHAGHSDVDMEDPGFEVIEISSAEEDIYGSSSGEEDAGHEDTKAMEDTSNEQANEEQEEMTFGERLKEVVR